ncbi:MAG: hypothetical protein HYT80_06585 [Euryarchaeota archaeon]|nr:hypothetical protein [Euryarchaeota archaeon]
MTTASFKAGFDAEEDVALVVYTTPPYVGMLVAARTDADVVGLTSVFGAFVFTPICGDSVVVGAGGDVVPGPGSFCWPPTCGSALSTVSVTGGVVGAVASEEDLKMGSGVAES